MEHLKVLDLKETEKTRQRHDKIQQEKSQRDSQLKLMQHNRRKEQRDNLRSELDTLKRYKEEMDRERKVHVEKKKQEREYFDRIIEENKRDKLLALKQKEK